MERNTSKDYPRNHGFQVLLPFSRRAKFSKLRLRFIAGGGGGAREHSLSRQVPKSLGVFFFPLYSCPWGRASSQPSPLGADPVAGCAAASFQLPAPPGTGPPPGPQLWWPPEKAARPALGPLKPPVPGGDQAPRPAGGGGGRGSGDTGPAPGEPRASRGAALRPRLRPVRPAAPPGGQRSQASTRPGGVGRKSLKRSKVTGVR